MKLDIWVKHVVNACSSIKLDMIYEMIIENWTKKDLKALPLESMHIY